MTLSTEENWSKADYAIGSTLQAELKTEIKVTGFKTRRTTTSLPVLPWA
jgi:hypothetical protein